MYNTNDGKIIYKESLDVTTFFFPQYISELKGIANGSKVPFHKVILFFHCIISNSKAFLPVFFCFSAFPNPIG